MDDNDNGPSSFRIFMYINKHDLLILNITAKIVNVEELLAILISEFEKLKKPINESKNSPNKLW